MASRKSPAGGRKKTAAKKTESRSRDPKKQSSSRKKAGSKQSSTKPAGSSKTGRKAKTAKSGTRETTAARSAPKKSTSARSSRSKAEKGQIQAHKSKARRSRGPSRFSEVLPVLLLVGGILLGLYIWLQATDPAFLSPVSAPDQLAEERHLPRKTREFEKSPGAAVPPADKVQASVPPESGSKPKAVAGAAPASAGPAKSPDERPRAAIIIDDIGDDRAMAERFFRIKAPLTYSILPHSRYQREIAEAAFRRGYQVMLHLPMEPNEYPGVDPGPGALLTGMTPDERIAQLKIDLASVPHIQGVNNHMGSKMTAMADQMRQVFTILKKRNLFFIDSRTTAATQCRSAARLFDLAFAERDVFLDHVQSREAIARQIEEFINVAEINGRAIAIGHPHPETYAVLSEKMPEIRERLRLVPASELAGGTK